MEITQNEKFAKGTKDFNILIQKGDPAIDQLREAGGTGLERGQALRRSQPRGSERRDDSWGG